MKTLLTRLYRTGDVSDVEDGELKRKARLLVIILLAALICSIFIAIVVPIWVIRPARSMAIVGFMIVLEVTLLLFIWRGHITEAAYLMTAGLCGVILYTSLISGGVRQVSFSAYVIVILTGGLLLGKRTALVLAIVGVLAGFLLVTLELTKRLPAYNVTGSEITWASASLIFIWSAIVIFVSLQNYEQAFRRARLEIEERQRTQARVELLREIDIAILEARTPERMAYAVLSNLPRLLPCQQARLALFDLDHNEAQIFLAEGEGDISTGSEPLQPGSTGSDPRVNCKRYPLIDFENLSELTRNHVILVRDAQEFSPDSPDNHIHKLLSKGMRSSLEVALLSEGILIGAIHAASVNPDTYHSEHVEVLRDLARFISIVLQSGRLLSASQQQAEELSVLYETAVSMSGMFDSESLLRYLAERVQFIIAPDTLVLALYDVEREELVLSQVIEDSRNLEGWQGRRLPLTDSGLTGWVVEHQQPLLIHDMLADPLPAKPKHGDRPARSWLGVPLVARNRLTGVLSVQSFQPNSFNHDHQRFLESLSIQVAFILENVHLFEQTEQHLHQTQALRNIDRAITSLFDLHEILTVVMEQVKERLQVDAVNILLYNPFTRTLSSAGRSGFHTGALRQTNLNLGESYAGQAALDKRIVQILDMWSNPGELARSTALGQEGFVSYLAVPLVTKGQVKGVMEVFLRKQHEPDGDWLDFLEALATQAAIAIENASLFQDLQRSNQELTLAYDTTLEGWSRALELRDQETEGHTQRVVNLTLRLAHKLGVPEPELVHIRRGALLHDIGKMGLPDHILFKPGPLNEMEWVTMRQHPVYAYRLLSPIAFLHPALNIPYYHHEKWDGTGYPKGLKGEEIPLSARIFAIVDVWDALNSNRPYRKALPRAKALEYIKQQAGRHFDPKVVAAFLEILVD